MFKFGSVSAVATTEVDVVVLVVVLTLALDAKNGAAGVGVKLAAGVLGAKDVVVELVVVVINASLAAVVVGDCGSTGCDGGEDA